MGSTLGDDAVQHVDNVVGVDTPLGLHRQRFAGELVNDVKQLDRATVVGDVELKIERPHLVWPLGPQAVTRHRRLPAALAFTPLGRNPEPFLAPQSLSPLAVDRPALLKLVSLTVPPARPLTREWSSPGFLDI